MESGDTQVATYVCTHDNVRSPGQARCTLQLHCELTITAEQASMRWGRGLTR